jgi:hypothetical protein
VPVPHRLTLEGEYQPRTHRAVVHGMLRVKGRPVPSAVIYLTRLNRTITPHGVTFHDADAAITLTTRAGAYALIIPLHTTRGFLASTPPTAARCTGPTFAPTGCRTTTTAGTESDPITISVP